VRGALKLPVLLLAALLLTAADAEREFNDFEVEGALVPRESIIAGGPGRDGIHSVDAPEFAPPEGATWVEPKTPVLGVELRGEARAYPVHLLEYHQIVNDVLGGVPVAVTFGPLSATALAFHRKLDDRVLSFGVSGLLYNSNFLMYDRETESLWSQFEGRAIAGPLAGNRLQRIRVRQESTATWLSRFPGSKILRRPDRMRIDYRYSPFDRYMVADRIPYPVNAQDRRFHAKELVVGVVVKGKARAYLDSLVTGAGGSVEDVFQGKRIQIRYDRETAVFNWEAPDDVELTEAYWFTWKAFHPETEIWREAKPKGEAKPQGE
jgi:hypothetical protein